MAGFDADHQSIPMNRTGLNFWSKGVLLLSLALTANAATVFTLGDIFTGQAPNGPTPWLEVSTAENLLNSDHLDVTLTAVNLLPGEFVTLWGMNYNPALTGVAIDFLALQNGVLQDDFSAPGNVLSAHGFDVLFGFTSANAGGNRFTDGESWTFTISADTKVTADDLLFLSSGNGGNGPFYTAAHVQGIDCPTGSTACAGSGGLYGSPFVDPNIPQVPEPTTYAMMATGLAAIGLWRRRRPTR